MRAFGPSQSLIERCFLGLYRLYALLLHLYEISLKIGGLLSRGSTLLL